MTVAYGCCVGSWERFGRYVVPSAGNSPLIGIANQTSISAAYNQILDAYRHGNDIEAIVLLHDDLQVTDPDAEAKLLEAFADPHVAIVGVAGGQRVRSIDWWNYDPVGHQMTDSGPVDFGVREGEVDYVEGSFIAIAHWFLKRHIFFDERCGFHGYEDICFKAKRAGKKVVVIDLDTHHHTKLGFKSPEVEQDWLKANERFKEKWS